MSLEMVSSDDFKGLAESTWINAASTGVMPQTAIMAAQNIVQASGNPLKIPEEVYTEIPQHLKEALGQLVHVPTEDIVIGNSASYGLHIWANGLPLQRGDEVLLVHGDFPATILPWLDLRARGVIVREISTHNHPLSEDILKAEFTDVTKVVCATWVDSFTGSRINLDEVGTVCRENQVTFLVNSTQALGAEPLDLQQTPVDGITCSGYKWLCGPYGTGFWWLRPDLRDTLQYNQAYWATMQGDRDLDQMRNYQLQTDLGAAKYDVFCTANPFNFLPWTESIKYLLAHGIPQIKAHNDGLIAYLHERLDSRSYKIHSPIAPSERTAIAVISHINPSLNPVIYEALTQNQIAISLREGNLRISPHLYNNQKDLDRLLCMLKKWR